MVRNTRFRTLVLLAAVMAVGALAASAVFQPTPPVATAGEGPAAQQNEGPANRAGQREGEQAIRKATAAYTEALNKGDLETVLTFWAADADYIDEAGKTTRGRDALGTLFKKGMADRKGSKARIRINSLKFLRPEVALEDGTLEWQDADGARESNRYAVVWVKSGDRWVISSARDLPTEVNDLPSLAYPHLKPLEWLVGEWRDDVDKVDVQVAIRWAPNKSFLLMDYTVQREGAEPMQVSQRIGWDGYNRMVRSWMFDTVGGFGESNWQRNGNRWTAETTGILPDGGTGGATNIIEFVDANTFIWRSQDREVDGQPEADIEIKFVRKAAK